AVNTTEAGASPTAVASTTPSASTTAAATTPTPPPTATPQGNLSPTEITALALQLVNNARVSRGLTTLSFSAIIAGEANAFAHAMGDQNFFPTNHVGLDGSTPASRFQASGYNGYFVGEAIAAGQVTAQQVVDTWLNSPAHAAILLNPKAVDCGIAYYYTPSGFYKYYWVLVTGSP
ncbi:MAG TPA: CAP domain-containing protein, partial [Dehalococcoidia bacterium]|nr:CAP domain-containing protein [Dehalococcoidia bacterium]